MQTTNALLTAIVVLLLWLAGAQERAILAIHNVHEHAAANTASIKAAIFQVAPR